MTQTLLIFLPGNRNGRGMVLRGGDPPRRNLGLERGLWEGRRMEYSRECFERTGGVTPSAWGCEHPGGVRSVQTLESVINEGLRAALLEESPDQSLEVLLEHMGKALNGERTYIFERNASGGDDNTYEWVAEGV